MWKHDLKDWELVPTDCYKFCLEQSEKRLKEVLDEGEKITNRTYTLLTFIIAALSCSLSFILKYTANNEPATVIEVVSVFNCVLLTAAMFLIYRVVDLRKQWSIGTEPQYLMISQYLEIENLDKDESYKYLLMSEAQQNQNKITNNSKQNMMRIRHYVTCLRLVIVCSLVSLISIFLSILF